MEELRRFERTAKSRKQMLKGQFDPSRHGYIAREPSIELKMPLMPSVSSVVDGRRTFGGSTSRNSGEVSYRTQGGKFMYRHSLDMGSG